VDGSQLRQVVHNLVINAVQAMSVAGVVRVSGRSAEGGRVRIEVADEGVGIPEGDVAHVFDPYFTTKEQGRGLGLAVVQSVVHKHGGTVSVRSRAGKGTTFEVLLPAAEPPSADEAAPTVSPTANPGRLLLVDDVPELRRIMATMLGEVGFDVETADGAAEASAVFRRAHEAGRPFRLVVLDMTLRGGASGAQCLAQLRAIQPGVLAVAMSGYTDTVAVLEPEKLGFGASLAKPFTREQLLDALGRASERRR
jgi:CheY-like chemotaxis protein